MAETQEKQQDSTFKRWLKIFGYGLFALVNLLFSILCFLSLVGAPLGVLSFSFFSSAVVNLIVNFVGLTGLGVSSGILSFGAFWTGYKKLGPVINAEEDEMQFRINAAIKMLKDLKKAVTLEPQINKNDLEKTYRQALSHYVLGTILELVAEYRRSSTSKLLRKFDKISIESSAASGIEADVFKSLYDELIDYNKTLSNLTDIEQPTPAVFYWDRPDIYVGKLPMLKRIPAILSNGGFTIIDLTGVELSANVQNTVTVIEAFLTELEKNPTQTVILPPWLLSNAQYESINTKTQRLNQIALKNISSKQKTTTESVSQKFDLLSEVSENINWIEQQQAEVEDLLQSREGDKTTILQGLRLAVAKRVELNILPLIARIEESVQSFDLEKSKLPEGATNEAQGLVTTLYHCLAQYNQTLLKLSNNVSDDTGIFYLTQIDNYIKNPALIETLCSMLAHCGFSKLDLTELEKQQDAEQTKATLFVIAAFLDELKETSTFTVQLPIWILEDKQYQNIIESTINLNNKKQSKNLPPIAKIEIIEDYQRESLPEAEDRVPPRQEEEKPAEQTSSWWQSAGEAVRNNIGKVTGAYQKKLLIGARAKLLYMLGELHDTGEDQEKLYAQAEQFPKETVKVICRNLAMVLHSDRRQLKQNAKQVERAKPYMQLYGKEGAIRVLTVLYALCQKTYEPVETFSLSEVEEIAKESQDLTLDFISKSIEKAEEATEAAKRQSKEHKEAKEAALRKAEAAERQSKEDKEAKEAAERQVEAAERQAKETQAQNDALKERIAMLEGNQSQPPAPLAAQVPYAALVINTGGALVTTNNNSVITPPAEEVLASGQKKELTF